MVLVIILFPPAGKAQSAIDGSSCAALIFKRHDLFRRCGIHDRMFMRSPHQVSPAQPNIVITRTDATLCPQHLSHPPGLHPRPCPRSVPLIQTNPSRGTIWSRRIHVPRQRRIRGASWPGRGSPPAQCWTLCLSACRHAGLWIYAVDRVRRL